MIEIEHGDCAIVVDPDCGGSIRALRWRGHDIFRPQMRTGVIGSGCFALVPFCNRIAASRFRFAGRTVSLASNHPDDADEPVLHGFGWVNPWSVEDAGPASVRLGLDFPAGAWPWRFRTEQEISLDHSGITMGLTVTNLAEEAMPAGLGFHPFFPRDQATIYHGLHRAEFSQDQTLVTASQPSDWWHGAPVGSRIVDTAYAGRTGPLSIVWPPRGLGVVVTPSRGLGCTHVYVPSNADFFCVEPVSHLPNALNSEAGSWPMKVLAPGEAWTERIHLRAYAAATR